MKIEFSGYVKDGKVYFRNQTRISQEVLNSGWNEFEVVIQKRKKNRSLEQNKWMWACMALLAEHTGYTKDEMLAIVKFKFLKGELVDTKTGEVYEYLRSSADLTTTEFSVFMEELIQWSAETLQVVLPYPNEELKLELNT